MCGSFAFALKKMFTVRRSKHNPLLAPLHDHPWEATAAFNWCPVVDKDITHCVYRAVALPELMGSKSGFLMSTIGHAQSTDGEHFTDRKQLIVPEEEWEKFGCEDPRVTKFEGQNYIFYTALSKYPFTAEGIKVAVALTDDFETIKERHLVTFFNAKAMTMFPERINGKICAFLTVHSDLPPSRICLVQFDTIEEMWSPLFWERWYSDYEKQALDPRRFMNDHVEIGAPPIKTSEGWLLVYSHIQNYFTDKKIFGIEALLLDINDPRKIIGRTKGPLLIPEESYEKIGQFPNIVFPSGAIVKDDKLYIYYGATDTTCCRASVGVKELIDSMFPDRVAVQIKRYIDNPIIAPKPSHSWEARATFNPAAIDLGGRVHLLYRAMSMDNTSVIGYASSADGFHFDERLDKPAYIPREIFEAKLVPGGNSGCEDPRIVKIGEMLYMCYTAYDGIHSPHVAITSISAEDFLAKRWNWSKPILITPENVDDKDTCIFPEKIHDKYMVLHRVEHTMCADFLNSLDFEKDKITRCIPMLTPRPGLWDGVKVGIASPPFKTKKGWLLLYHGVSITSTYRVGAVLLDLDDPTIILGRTNAPILAPELAYEKLGQIPNVVFPCGVIERDGILFIYYGGGDSVVGVATMKVDDLLRMLS